MHGTNGNVMTAPHGPKKGAKLPERCTQALHLPALGWSEQDTVTISGSEKSKESFPMQSLSQVEALVDTEARASISLAAGCCQIPQIWVYICDSIMKYHEVS